MARLSKDEIHQNYKTQSLKLMIKFDDPTLHQIHNHLCLRDNCPVEHCDFMLGFKNGEQCQHVAHVQSMISKLKDIVDKY